jgi:hypothetical protein
MDKKTRKPLGYWLESQFEMLSTAALDKVILQLKQYDVIRDNAEKLANEGIRQARQRGLRRTPTAKEQVDYFFAWRWMILIGYQESLRWVPDHPRVERLLSQLPSSSINLLRWRYVDQSSDEDVARLFVDKHDMRRIISVKEARACSITAYRDLCALIEMDLKRSPVKRAGSRWEGGSPFPLFPGVYHQH